MKRTKILIVGAGGLLGEEFVQFCRMTNKDYVGLTHQDLDVTDEQQLTAAVEKIHPDLIINCAAYAKVDAAEDNQDLTFRINAQAVEFLSRLCAQKGMTFMHFSSDQVFGGEKETPYREEDQPNPLNVYAKSKLAGEQAVVKYAKDFLLFRVSWLIGRGKNSFLNKLPQWAGQSNRLKMVFDETSVPTATTDIVRIAFLAYERGLRGLFHLTSTGFCRRYDFAKYYLERIKSNIELTAITAQEFNAKANRPSFSAMDNRKISKALGIEIPTWQEAVEQFIQISGNAQAVTK